MEIKCIVTVKELKELLKKETPVTGTTDVSKDNKIISNSLLKNQLFGQQI